MDTARMQALADAGEKSLAHFGVRGMKWGVRKSKAASAAASAGKTVGKVTARNLLEIGRGATVSVLSVVAGVAVASQSSSDDAIAIGALAGIGTRTALTIGTSTKPGQTAGRIAKKTGLNIAKGALIITAGATALDAMENSGMMNTTTASFLHGSVDKVPDPTP